MVSLMINISPGKVIIDTTLIEFPNYTLLESDISIVDAFSGFFVVSIGFNYLHDNYENKAKFTLAFVNHAGQSTDFYTVILMYFKNRIRLWNRLMLLLMSI
jgi:hypothetical protein